MGTKCPKCGIPYSDTNILVCLLCGSDLPAIQATVETPKVAKKGKQKGNLEIIQVTDNIVLPFDDTGGFSKKNDRQEVLVEQLRADKESLERRLNSFEEIYKREHPEAKPWYTSFLNWFALLLVLGLLYLIYWFIELQGGLPHEFYDLLRRIRL